MSDIRKSVLLNLTHDFLVDTKGLCEWAEENLELKMLQGCEDWIEFVKESELTAQQKRVINHKNIMILSNIICLLLKKMKMLN